MLQRSLQSSSVSTSPWIPRFLCSPCWKHILNSESLKIFHVMEKFSQIQPREISPLSQFLAELLSSGQRWALHNAWLPGQYPRAWNLMLPAIPDQEIIPLKSSGLSLMAWAGSAGRSQQKLSCRELIKGKSNWFPEPLIPCCKPWELGSGIFSSSQFCAAFSSFFFS